MTTTTLLNFRRRVRADRPADGSSEWFIPQQEQIKLATSNAVFIRRRTYDGQIVWYDTPGRSSLSDDLVDPHAALAMEVGLSVGRIEGAWRTGAINESTLAKPTRVPRLRQPAANYSAADPTRRLVILFRPLGKYSKSVKGSKIRAALLRAKTSGEFKGDLALEAVLTHRYLFPDDNELVANSFRYSKAFNSGKELWWRVSTALNAVSTESHASVVPQHLARLVASAMALITTSVTDAFETGRLVGDRIWNETNLVKELENTPFLNCVYSFLAAQLALNRSSFDKRTLQQARAAVWFLSGLRATDYLAFVEMLAPMRDNILGDEPTNVDPGPLRPAWPRFGNSSDKVPKRGPKKESIVHEKEELVREFVNKHPAIKKYKIFDEFTKTFPNVILRKDAVNHLVYPRNRATPKRSSKRKSHS